MWIILGVGAIIFAILNIIRSFSNKETKWFGYASLSLTALTLCAFYSVEASRAVSGDWVGLLDIMLTMSIILWICTIVSILINSIALLMCKK